MIATRAALVLAAALNLTGCAAIIGPGGWVASNAVPLTNFVLLSTAITMGQQAVLTTKQLIHAQETPQAPAAKPVTSP